MKTPKEVIAEQLYTLAEDAGCGEQRFQGLLDTIISALGTAGFVMAPKQPTAAMLKAADSIMGAGFTNSRSDREIYEAMIEAAGK